MVLGGWSYLSIQIIRSVWLLLFLSFNCFIVFSVFGGSHTSNCMSLDFGLVLSGIDIVFTLDYYSGIFFFLGSFVLVSILSFSNWYMSDEPSQAKFTIYLVIFLFFMILLVLGGTVFSILIGWEGVGIMSFLLIAWWLSRSEASSSSVQAMIYNRVSDFGIYLGLFMLLLTGSGLGFNDETLLSMSGQLSIISKMGSVFLFASILAKSSQFLFHPWLPNAMESPTPVSALLHSSTMVVAGVFLSIRVSGMFSDIYSSSFVLLFASLTMLYGAMSALGHTDMKKIIAFSTTSQLGFMLCGVAMGNEILSFFHMCMHAFFKSLIFISSSVFIHSSMSSVQDIRSSGVISSSYSYCCVFLCSLSMGSFPFLSSYFSKDLLFENSFSSTLNRLVVIVWVVASVMTMGYSFRLMLSLYNFRHDVLSKSLVFNIESSSVLGFMLRLKFMAVVFSFLFIYQLGFFEEEWLWFYLKIIPLFIIMLGSLVSFMWSKNDLYLVSNNISNFLNFYNPMVHRFFLGFIFLLFTNLLVLLEYFWWGFLYTSSLSSMGALATRIGGLWTSVAGVRLYFTFLFLFFCFCSFLSFCWVLCF